MDGGGRDVVPEVRRPRIAGDRLAFPSGIDADDQQIPQREQGDAGDAFDDEGRHSAGVSGGVAAFGDPLALARVLGKGHQSRRAVNRPIATHCASRIMVRHDA